MVLPVILVSFACGSKPPTRSISAPPRPKENMDVERCLRRAHNGTETSKFHTLREGETLYRVSMLYGTTVDELIRLNDIYDHRDIPKGTRLLVPEYTMTRGFLWPVPGKISSGFGRRGRRNHNGIDIPAPRGTPIRAAADGLVVASARSVRGYSGYGRIVLVAHGNGMRTLYAHTSRNNVNRGECVRAGQVIAEVGATGRATGNHLHFEVRQNGRAVNPMSYLP